MSVEKKFIIDIEIENQKDFEKLQNEVKVIEKDFNKLTNASNNNRKSILENGGAMGLLSAATGGLAMDFKDAIEAIELTGVSLKGLRGAIIATGIGALAIVILELVTNWEKWRDVIKQTTPAMKALRDVQTDVTAKLKETYTELFNVKSAFDQARRGAISKEEALNTYNETLGDTLGKADSLEEAERIYATKTGDYIKATQLRMTAQLLLAQAADEAAKVATGENLDLSIWEQAGVAIKGIFVGVGRATAEAMVKNQNQSKSLINQLLTLAEQFETGAIEKYKKGGINFKKVEEKKTATFKAEIRKRLEAIDTSGLDQTAKTRKQADEIIKNLEASLTPDETPADKLRREYEENKKILEASNYSTLALTAKFNSDMFALQHKANKDKKSFAEDEALIEENKNRVIAQSQQNLFNIINNLEQAGLSKSKAGQAIQKTIALTQIGIDSAVALGNATKLANAEGVAAQLAFPTVPGAGTIARITSYASTAAQVISNIARARTLLSSGGKSSGGSGNSGNNSTNSVSTPQANFNIVGQSNQNILADVISNRQQQPVEAFVVGSSVTSQQELDANKIRNSTFL